MGKGRVPSFHEILHHRCAEARRTAGDEDRFVAECAFYAGDGGGEICGLAARVEEGWHFGRVLLERDICREGCIG